ncbi:hypothetical protein [Sulfurimonas sp.]|uniref:hypothetical protein n=1 Tax=Sulfurimonas sp. TaxID=2022749 RepID=UPI0025FAA319|nr:hypothetical protein [Sulfurimonas sp.]MDD5156555.1 hypothetical protein [Sulfurimonas sp.]
MKTKTITFLLLFFMSTILVATELEWVDEQIEAIKPPRNGIKITTMTDTFVFLEKNKKEKKEARKGLASSTVVTVIQKPGLPSILTIKESVKKRDYQLIAVMNKSALIDERWYKKGEKIDGYMVVDIDKNSVTLKDGGKEIILSTSSQKQTLKFKNK